MIVFAYNITEYVKLQSSPIWIVRQNDIRILLPETKNE